MDVETETISVSLAAFESKSASICGYAWSYELSHVDDETARYAADAGLYAALSPDFSSILLVANEGAKVQNFTMTLTGTLASSMVTIETSVEL